MIRPESPEERAAVVAEARTWLRTPYHHYARVKGAGVDCAQLPIAVYSAVDLIPALDPSYARQWHLHRSEELYLAEVLRWAREVLSAAEAGPGGFVLWKYGRTFSHGGILIGGGEVIHAVEGQGVLVANIEHQGPLSERDRRFFTLWEG